MAAEDDDEKRSRRALKSTVGDQIGNDSEDEWA